MKKAAFAIQPPKGLANFFQSKWKRSEIRDSIFHRADLREIKLEDIRLIESGLGESQMAGTALKGLDLTTCDIEGMSTRTEDLQGASVSPNQAVELSRLFGLIVKS